MKQVNSRVIELGNRFISVIQWYVLIAALLGIAALAIGLWDFFGWKEWVGHIGCVVVLFAAVAEALIFLMDRSIQAELDLESTEREVLRVQARQVADNHSSWTFKWAHRSLAWGTFLWGFGADLHILHVVAFVVFWVASEIAIEKLSPTSGTKDIKA